MLSSLAKKIALILKRHLVPDSRSDTNHCVSRHHLLPASTASLSPNSASLLQVRTGRCAPPADPEEEQRRQRSSLFSQKSPKYHCQKSAIDSSYLNSRGTTQTSLKPGGGQSATCFKCKPACCKTPARVKWRLVGSGGLMRLSLATAVTCLDWNNSENIFEKSQTISPPMARLFSLLSDDEPIETQHLKNWRNFCRRSKMTGPAQQRLFTGLWAAAFQFYWPSISRRLWCGSVAYPYNLQPSSAGTYFYNLYYFIS